MQTPLKYQQAATCMPVIINVSIHKGKQDLCSPYYDSLNANLPQESHKFKKLFHKLFIALMIMFYDATVSMSYTKYVPFVHYPDMIWENKLYNGGIFLQ